MVLGGGVRVFVISGRERARSLWGRVEIRIIGISNTMKVKT
jgi:hypothetical protein